MAAAPDAVYIRKLLQKSTEEDGDKKFFIYLQTKVYDDRMEFLILDARKNATFKAEVTTEKIKSISDSLKIPYDEFYKSCHDALTASNIGMPGFIYEIDRKDNMLKLYHKEHLVVRYLEMELKELTPNHQVLDAAVDLIERQEKAAKMIAADNISEETLNELMARSADAKETLIRKFAMLLNAKKKRILALEKQLKVDSKDEDDVPLSDIDNATDGDSDKEAAQPAKRQKLDVAAEAGKEQPASDNDSDDYVSEVLKNITEADAGETEKAKSNAGTEDVQAEPNEAIKNGKLEPKAPTASNNAVPAAAVDPAAITQDAATAVVAKKSTQSNGADEDFQAATEPLTQAESDE